MEFVILVVTTLGGGLCAATATFVAFGAWSRARRLGAEHTAAEERWLAERGPLERQVSELVRERDEAVARLTEERATRERVEAEQAAARQREQSLLEAQEAFLARMSHELRTPLNAVDGYCELLLEDADGTIRPDLERIRIAAANLGALVTSVLDLSELQSGDFAIRPEVLKVQELVDKVVGAVRFVADQQRDTIEVDIEPGMAVTLDRRMLHSILFHLVSNACKFTMKGTVRIVARSAQPNLGGVPTDAIELVVADTGIGMTPRQKEMAFLPFEQGDGSFTRRYDGGGIGLAVVNGFVRAMGGEVAVHSTPGAGATIKVLLPKEVRARAEGLGEDDDTILLR